MAAPEVLCRATTTTGGIRKKVTKGQVYAIPSGSYVNGQDRVAEGIRTGVYRDDRPGKTGPFVFENATGEFIQQFL